MKIKILQALIITGLVMSSMQAAVQIKDMNTDQLKVKEKDVIGALTEYWIDKEGNMRVGGKDATSQFAFTESMINRMSEAQLRSSMTSAIARFNEAQKQAFTREVDPYLVELGQVKLAMAEMRTKLDKAAEDLGKIMGKKAEEILSLPDQNLTALIQARVTDGAKKVDANIALTTIKKLRPAFDIQTKDVPLFEGISKGGTEPTDPKKTSSGTGGRVAGAVAAGLASSDFKLSNIAGFVGTAVQYGMCRDRIFDIVKDSQGIHFMTEAR